MDQPTIDNLVRAIYVLFDNFPKNGKPVERQWTHLAAVIATFSPAAKTESSSSFTRPDNFRILTIATGTKCLGADERTSAGVLVNDSHAEILARRRLVRMLLDEIALLKGNKFYCSLLIESAANGTNSVISTPENQSTSFRIKSNVKFHMFMTHVPCGDAAIIEMEPDVATKLHKKRKLDNNEPTQCELVEKKERMKSTELEAHPVKDIYRTGAKCVTIDAAGLDMKLSGEKFHLTGVLRRKPGRGSPTLSMSCSDKLFKWCCVGFQGAFLSSMLTHAIFFESLIVLCEKRIRASSLDASLRRALHNRIAQAVQHGIFTEFSAPCAPKIYFSSLEFKFGKLASCDAETASPAPCSIVWCCSPSLPVDSGNERKRFPSIEVLSGGHLHGVSKKNLSSSKVCSNLCPKGMRHAFAGEEEIENFKHDAAPPTFNTGYRQTKRIVAAKYYELWDRCRNDRLFSGWLTKPDLNEIGF